MSYTYGTGGPWKKNPFKKFKRQDEWDKRRNVSRARLLRWISKHATVYDLKKTVDNIMKDYKRIDVYVKAKHKGSR